MRPYYQDDYVTLYHGDALGIAPTVAGGVMVTDPPYGLGGRLSKPYKGGTAFLVQHWDASLDVRDKVLAYWGEMPAAVFASPRRPPPPMPYREAPLIWDKGDMPAMGDTTFPWRLTYELIYISGDGWTGHRGPCVLRFPHNTTVATAIGHPSTKPVALMAHLIGKAPSGTILDPFAGSGSTLVAAKSIGRHAIGIEIEERYCEVAAKRLSQEVLGLTP